MQGLGVRILCCFIVFSMALPFEVMPSKASAQDAVAAKTFKQEELDQMLAPIALYPDSLVTQILMASTYPLEVVQADRWVKQNKDMKGDALTKALEAQPWDPSVKSLVNFPQVLAAMSEKLDLTQKLGDAFLAQQKEVMDTIQKLRAKAQAAGNLKTTKEQKVVVEKETIIIESASPEVIYVPSYNPTVVYGSWWYPAYPPSYYYPPVYATPYAFGAGIALGAAWGYAWGHSDWHGGNVDYNYNQNVNINNKIDRGKYEGQRPSQQPGRGQGGQAGQGGRWQHDASHRGGVAYRDQKTAQQYNRGAGSEAAKSREAFRGRAEQGRQDIARGGADNFKGGGQGGNRGQGSSFGQGGSRDSSGRGGAYSGMDRGGASTRDFSSRGNSSRQSSSSGSRGGGSGYSGGGGSRGGGGGSRGGGGGGSRGGGGGGRR